MISVTISINGCTIYTRTAVNKTGFPIDEAGHHSYHVDDGSTLLHKRDDGAVALAKAMLDTIKENDTNTHDQGGHGEEKA